MNETHSKQFWLDSLRNWAVLQPMSLTWPTLETVDDARATSLAAVAHAMLDPAATSGPTIPAILAEDLPDSLPVDLHRLQQDVVGLVGV